MNVPMTCPAPVRAAAVAQLRQLADHLEQLPLDDVVEVLVLLEPVLDDLRRQAAFALERAPSDPD